MYIILTLLIYKKSVSLHKDTIYIYLPPFLLTADCSHCRCSCSLRGRLAKKEEHAIFVCFLQFIFCTFLSK